MDPRRPMDLNTWECEASIISSLNMSIVSHNCNRRLPTDFRFNLDCGPHGS